MKKEEKIAFVNWLRDELSQAASVVVTNFRGLTVAQMNDLRARCREAGVTLKVVKNTLLRIASQGTPADGIMELVEGPVALAWSREDPGAAARVLVNFAKERGNEALQVRGAIAGGKLMDAETVKNVLATLPTRGELLARMAGLLAAGPRKLAQALAAGPAMLGRALAALEQKKKEAA